jgi:DNA-binding CsgD family transcriptional regulator/tetratricopeptide (TPR) repeat protein
MRYRLLEPLRQCAATGLAARDDADRVRRRHAEHYRALASRFDPLGTRGVRPTISIEQVEQEEANLLAALHWARTQPSDLALRLCEALAPFWELGGRLNAGRAWFEEALGRDGPDTPDVDDPLRVRALGWAVRLAWRQGDYERATVLDDERLDLARRIGDTRGCAAAHCTMGLVAFSRGDADAAEEHCRESIVLARSVGDQALPVWALISWGWARFSAGDLPGGDEKLRQALEANRLLGNPSATAQALLGLQFGALLAGDVAAQRAHLTGVLGAMRDGAALEQSDWLGCYSTLAAVEGRSHAALRLLAGAEAFNRRRGSRAPEATLMVTAEHFVRVRQELGAAVVDRLTAEGAGMSWDELVAEALAEPGADDGRDGQRHLLTPRELEIAGLVAQGLTNADVARKLSISRRTVESHVDHIRQKLGLRNRQEIVIWALQRA